MTPIAGGKGELLEPRGRAALRGRFGILWMFLPGWRDAFDPFLAHHERSIDRAGLALAHVTMDMLSLLALQRDISVLGDLYPVLGDLLSGRKQLPPSGEISAAVKGGLGGS
ncbi:hypothetical protein AB0M43_36695 [Longispora sp. NPDC051575]|uniref:hypothetical protein n=1 Tax=Longispora sp. NPDC051575 TaxID=3154943 RepID=UPI003420E00C